MYKIIHIIVFVMVISSCTNTNITPEIQPVQNFDINKYLGVWYEIARLDNSFQESMQNVTATYSLRKDGGINVLNKGYKTDEKRWSQAQGVAYFMDEKNKQEAYLKVSFFRPFYASYVVFELDKDYTYAYVGGNTKEYLWLLARTKTVSKKIKNDFIEKTKAKGYNTEKLIWSNHDPK